jgi:hypothetical protein
VLFPEDRQFWFETFRILGQAAYGGPQPRELYDHLTGPAHLAHFTAMEGADAHGHAGAERLAMARIFDRLDSTLDVPPHRARPHHQRTTRSSDESAGDR